MCHEYAQLCLCRETLPWLLRLWFCVGASQPGINILWTGKKTLGADIHLLSGRPYLTGWIHPAISINSCQTSGLELCYGAGQGSNYLCFSQCCTLTVDTLALVEIIQRLSSLKAEITYFHIGYYYRFRRAGHKTTQLPVTKGLLAKQVKC